MRTAWIVLRIMGDDLMRRKTFICLLATTIVEFFAAAGIFSQDLTDIYEASFPRKY
jgi:hypothetical protein